MDFTFFSVITLIFRGDIVDNSVKILNSVMAFMPTQILSAPCKTWHFKGKRCTFLAD